MVATSLARWRLIRRFRLRGIEFPIAEFVKPARLTGILNGHIPDLLLVPWTDHRGKTCRMMIEFRRPWVALVWLAQLHTGRHLTFTSPADVYRDMSGQVSMWGRRMTLTHLPGRPSRMCGHPDGRPKRWWLLPGMAGCACPGTSNHGWGGAAVDHNTDKGRPVGWLRWLAVWAPLLGYSWEAPSEDWHVRYCLGDDIAPAVMEIESCRAMGSVDVGYRGNNAKLVQAIVGAKQDGWFGPATKAAVIVWQTQQQATYVGLRVDGVWDAGCWWIAKAA